MWQYCRRVKSEEGAAVLFIRTNILYCTDSHSRRDDWYLVREDLTINKAFLMEIMNAMPRIIDNRRYGTAHTYIVTHRIEFFGLCVSALRSNRWYSLACLGKQYK
jgi:hypothetical protein